MIPLPMLTIDVIWRFWNHVDRRGPEECWFWRRQTSPTGYNKPVPHMKIDGVTYYVPRVAFKLHNGFDPGIFLVCHECDQPYCTNPKHLFLGTHEDNLKDCAIKGRAGVAPKFWRYQIEEVKQLILTGQYTQRQIASMLRINQQDVSKIKVKELPT